MKPYYQDSQTTIYHGDALEVLEQLEPVDLVITDPPYSTMRAENEFASSEHILGCLQSAGSMAPTMMMFGTSSWRGIQQAMQLDKLPLPYSRCLVWHRRFVNSPAAGPWRFDIVLIHVFGRGCFGRPQLSSLIQTDGTRGLSLKYDHKAPVPLGVMEHLYQPFAGAALLDPFMGTGSSVLAARRHGGHAIGIDIEEKYCEITAERCAQLPLWEEGHARTDR